MTENNDQDEAMIAFANTLPVYFAFSESDRLVKIGFSINIRLRLRSILSDTQVRGPLALIGWLPGGPNIEAELHRLFAKNHHHGEWFEPSPDMATFIDAECSDGEPPVIVNGQFRVTTSGYWAARRRVDGVEMERVVHRFPDGRTFTTRERVVTENHPLLTKARAA
jgi:hypothetical protein